MIWRLLKIWLCVLAASVVGAWAIIWTVGLVEATTISNTGNGELQWVFWATIGSPPQILFLSVGALSMLLNGVRAVRENGVGRFLSFFLVPVLFWTMMGLWTEHGALIMMLPVYLPFFVCLTVGYIWFSRKIKKVME